MTQTGWQAKTVRLLSGRSDGWALRHLRRRLDTAPVAVLPGYRVGRALGLLKTLANRSTPRAQAAMLRSLLNGWCTRSRFQELGSCTFRCGFDDDSLKHAAHCRVLHSLMATHMRGSGFSMPRNLDGFLCMSSNMSAEETVLRGIGHCASHRLFNLLRKGGLPSSDMGGALRQFVRFASKLLC